MDISLLFVWFIDNLSSPYFTGAFCGLLTFIMMYIDSRITRKEIHRRTYTKNILLVSILTGTLVYILKNTSIHPKINKIVEGTTKSFVGGGVQNTLSYDTADILLGEPNF